MLSTVGGKESGKIKSAESKGVSCLVKSLVKSGQDGGDAGSRVKREMID